MTRDSSESLPKETRLVLSDMTNVPSKRGISSLLGDLLLKSGDDSGKNAAREGSGVKFSKRLCLVVDDLVKESTRTSDSNDGSSDDYDKNSGNFDLVDVKESQGETDAGVEPSKVDDSGCNLLKETCDMGPDMTVFASQTDAVTGEDLALTVFSSSNSESDDHRLVVVEAKSSEGAGLLLPSMNRCSTVGGVGTVSHSLEADNELKSCSCSFCLKAAYIWSDLHYQDIKGRLSVLKKSQKEASRMIQRNGKGKPTDIDSSNSTSAEFDLMGHWGSLFLNMEDILARESNHLQKSFVAMKEMRENCKIDLEKAMKSPQLNNT